MNHTPSLLATILLFTAAASLPAAVKLPAIFGDHMVLQEGMKLPVWGTADPDESVTVTVGTESGAATADAAGKWRVDLAPLPTNATPVTMTVAGKTNTVTFADVLVGEVWVCSGQSNMAFTLGGGKYGFGGAHNAATVLPQANDPQLRLFRVPGKTALDPVDDMLKAPTFGAGVWELCTPDTAGRFSAVGYFFGRDLRQHLNRPVGLIGTSWGGTQAQAWISLSGLQKDPNLQSFLATEEKTRADFPQATAEYPAKLAAYRVDQTNWQQTVVAPYKPIYLAWVDAVNKAKAAGQPLPPMPHYSRPPPREPTTPDGGHNAPTALFNGMIAPFIPFGIKGVIWYQGESDSGRSVVYQALFSRLITDWREKWGEGDFPFLYVQLAGFKADPIQNQGFLRDVQLKALSIPNTGMATAVDIGVPDNIHPPDKDDVGHRLALVAEHVAYGENVVYSGPIYQAMKIDGNAIDLSFTQVGSGLVIGQAPWVPGGLKPLPTDKLLGFTIAGDDKNWVLADAKIVGDTVVVSSPQVPAPVAVRYDWANAPQGNLYNKEGLPAPTFRTDDWVEPAAEGLPPDSK